MYSNSLRMLALTIFLGFGLSIITYPIYAQSSESIEALKPKVETLIKQQRFTEALPILEKIVAAEPANAEMQFYLGFALLGQGNNTKDSTQRKALRIRGRNAFIKAKELGVKEPVVDALIESIPADGSG